MKRPYTPYYLLLFALLSACPWLRSQDVEGPAAGERIAVCTDRTLYVSGEQVLFSVSTYDGSDPFAEPVSRIFYCEMITPDGTRIAGGKYPLSHAAGEGCLTIPEETLTGIYFLKCYTRIMRNLPTDTYAYILLKIINPSKPEVLPERDAPDTIAWAGNNREAPPGELSLTILSDSRRFAPREEVRLTIHRDPAKELTDRLCLSVVPAFTCEDPCSPVRNSRNAPGNGAYVPETRGISLSGQLLGKESGQPVFHARVNLSIIGDRDILAVRTDSSGRFFFSLPGYTGNRDIFLSAEELPEITPELFIDNDFCSRTVHLPSPRFTLNEDELKAAYQLAVNTRITSLFRKEPMATAKSTTGGEPVTGDSLREETSVPFYGEPTDVLVLEKYIDLPTLEDYFTELPVIVKVRKVQGIKQFRFYLSQAELLFNEPLVLIDWVAVDDIGKILALSPGEIDRVELVNSPYIKGNIIYGGIISFVSKKNDFAGIDLPTSGTFVNYSFLNDCTGILPPASSTGHIPDSRNTLYWNPAVQTTDDGDATIAFTAPDTPGTYCILLREIKPTGDVVLVEERVEVQGSRVEGN
ncbi:MAG: hypothetical protein D4R67_03065 [Bacteroidetes bacterium]|nr:MAG: hypothetical protein D4R67_03065 [Bacteroidota bacterium]